MGGKLKWWNKLVTRIPLLTGAIIFAVMVILCITLGGMTYKIVSGQVLKEVDYIAENNAKEARNYLENMNTLSTALSQEMSRSGNGDSAASKQAIENILRSSLKNPKIFSSYVALEPNLFIPGTPDGLSVYAYREGTNINVDINEDYSTYAPSEYYAPTKELLSTHVTEPYAYELSNGETVWLITLSNPIIDNSGRFAGVANCDILTDSIEGLPYGTGGYDSSYSYIITGDGTYISNTKDPEAVGTAFEADAPTMAAVQNAEKYMSTGVNPYAGNKNAWFMYVPVKLDGTDAVWSSAFVVNKAEALAAVSTVTGWTAVIGISGVLLLLFFSSWIIRKGLAPIGAVVAVAEKMGEGDLQAAENTVKSKDELGQLAAIFDQTSQALSGYIQEIHRVLNTVASGNLNVTIDQNFIGDFENIKTSMEHILQSLNKTFSEITVAAEQVSSSADQVSAGAQVLSQGAVEQAASIEELSATISRISGQIRKNASNAADAKVKSEKAGTEIIDCNVEMQNMITAMNDISSKSNEIGKIIKTIDDIAFQTNILALNAAVEAARAGSAGKGFAVVADEVRNLAGKSASAAKNTASLIEETVGAVEKGVIIADSTAKAMTSAVESAKSVTQLVDFIADASEEQADSVKQVTIALEQISSIVQSNSATSEESAAASEELNSQALMLKQLVGRFQLTQNP